MNKMIRRLSLLLALVLCLSAGCAGVSAAETATAEEAAGMEFFMAMMQAIPGMDQIDWAGFAKEFEAKQASGAEITLEDCLPADAWSAFGKLQFLDENGQVPEDLPLIIDVSVNLKSSIEQMAGAGIDTSRVVMTLRFLNADGSVIYEKSYTYEELTKALEPAA